MAQKSNSDESETKDLVNKDGSITKLTEFATAEVESIEGLIELFGQQGVSYSSGEEATGDFKLVNRDEKQLFLTRIAGEPAFIVRWEFHDGNNGEFVTMYVFIEKHGKFIINDGAKGGCYGQLSKITSVRVEQGMTDGREKAGVLVKRGFKQNNPFWYRTAPKDHPMIGKAISRTELANVPDDEKALAKPTWRLEF